MTEIKNWDDGNEELFARIDDLEQEDKKLEEECNELSLYCANLEKKK